MPVTGPPYRVQLGDLQISTPVITPTHTYYSDAITMSVEWSGCIGLRIIAFSDCNHDGVQQECEECEDEADNCCLSCHFTCAHGSVVPTEERTWGAIKSMYNQ
jgi:hypothetical protein